MRNNRAERYPYLQVVVMFTGLSSVSGGLLVQLILLIIFREANFAQIGLQPLLYVGLLGVIPALLAGLIIANRQIWHSDARSTRKVFLIGFIVSTLYIAAMIVYLGINSIEEVAILAVAMLIIGLFGGVNLVLASVIALPKACTTSFDKVSKKGDDIYQAL